MQTIAIFVVVWGLLTAFAYRKQIYEFFRAITSKFPAKTVWRLEDGCPITYAGEFFRKWSEVGKGFNYYCPRCETVLVTSPELGGRKALCRPCWVDFGELPNFLDPDADTLRELIEKYPYKRTKRKRETGPTI